MNEALALKYRPKKLADLVGQEHVAQTLSNALSNNAIHHAYLFSGPFGCGKTSAARILAAMLNCEKGPTLEPCGECVLCKQIFSGECTDIKELNAAGNRGIDDIRNIADYAATRPLMAKWKVIILDECHSLTREAVESALKLIEEPPPNVVFILCTTDAQKMKATIHSRCMPFRFAKVSWPQILGHLKSIAEKENINAEEGALRLAARLSKGSMRNAVNNLQLLLTFSGNNPITADMAQKALGAVSDNDYFGLVDAIVAPDAAKGIKIVQSIFTQGQDVEQAVNGLLEHLRNLMVLTTCENTSGLLYLSDEDKKRYTHQYAKLSVDMIVEMMSLVYEITRGVAYNISPQVLFEQFVVKSIMKCQKLIREAKAK